MTLKTETTTVSHRLVNVRTKSAGCSCGATSTGDGSADLRAQHKAHKANPTPVKKAATKTAPAATKATVKPRPRRAAKAKVIAK